MHFFFLPIYLGLWFQSIIKTNCWEQNSGCWSTMVVRWRITFFLCCLTSIREDRDSSNKKEQVIWPLRCVLPRHFVPFCLWWLLTVGGNSDMIQTWGKGKSTVISFLRDVIYNVWHKEVKMSLLCLLFAIHLYIFQ
jgi:hypothetical protein